MVFSSSGMLLICHASLVFLLRVTKFLCIVNEFSKTGNSWFILQFKILSINAFYLYTYLLANICFGGGRSVHVSYYCCVSLDIKTEH